MNLYTRKFYRILAFAAGIGFCFCQACRPYGGPDPSLGEISGLLPDNLESPSPLSADSDPQTLAEFLLIKQELGQGLSSLDYMTQHTYYRDPEAAGLIPCYPAFWDISETGWARREELIKSLKFQLNSMDKTALPQEQQFSYDVLSAYADLELAQEGMEHFRLIRFLSPKKGLMVRVPRMLASLPFYSRQDAEDYLTLLSDLPRLYEDLIQLCRETSGEITFTEQWLKDAADACIPYTLDAEHNSLAFSFSSRLSRIPGLTEEERADYEARNRLAITQWVIPAYQTLRAGLLELPCGTPEYEGLCGQKNGRLYYSRMVNRCSGTSYPNIRKLLSGIEHQLEQNALLLDELLAESDLPEGGSGTVSGNGSQTVSEHSSQTFSEGGSQTFSEQGFQTFSEGGSQTLPDPNKTLQFLKTETEKYFPAPMERYGGLSVQKVSAAEEDALDLPCLTNRPLDSALPDEEGDSSRTLLIDQRTADNRELLYAALSYTGFPGKYYRESYLNCRQDAPLTALISFPGWEKGWDLYGRSYAISFENGLTQKDRQIARLSLSSFTAIRALIDIQVNYYGWDLKDVNEFLSERYGLGEEGIAGSLYREVLYSPGDSAAEYAGYLEIRQLKTRMAEIQGENFDEIAFHRFLLDLGPAPFGLLWDKLPKM